MATATSIENNENEIRKLIDSWADAVAAKDIDAIMKHYSEDVVVFDVPPPLQETGRNAYRKHWESWFKMFDGPLNVEFKNMEITVGDEVGFLHTLTRVSEQKSGPDSGSWVRVTVGYRKIDGDWIATHEHVSIPAGG
jgi:uncharacterized protein (TIGR02246 family)